jgi:hypothetical protein
MELSTKFCIARVARSAMRVNRHQINFDAPVVTEDTGRAQAAGYNKQKELPVVHGDYERLCECDQSSFDALLIASED